MMRLLYDTVSGNMYSFDDAVVSKMIGDTCYDKETIDRKISAVLKIQGQKATKNELPLTGNERGFVWIVTEDNAEYVWLSDQPTGTLANWEKLGPVIDLSGYYTKQEINDLLGTVPEGKTVMGLLGMDGSEAKTLKELVADAQSKADDAYTLAGQAKTAAETADGKAAAAQNTANAALPATTFETWKTGNTEAINAAKKAGDDARTDLNSYKTTNDLAVAAAKKAGDDAQTDLNNYKTSNDQAVAAAKKSGDDAQTDLNNYKTSNNQAVQAAASAASTADGKAVVAQEAIGILSGTVSRNKTLADQLFKNLGSVIGDIGYAEFTGAEFVPGTTYYVRASTGVYVETEDEAPAAGTTYYTRNSDVITTVLQNLKQQLTDYIAEHKVLPASTADLTILPDFVWQTVTTGSFDRYTTYYYVTVVEEEQVRTALTLGTDYLPGDDIAAYITATSRTLNIKHIPSMSEVRAATNAASAILNQLIAAHKAAAVVAG